jgi:hypothetical protein
MSVTDKWTPEGEAFQREMNALKGLEVFVGFQRGTPKKKRKGKKKAETEADVLDIAVWNELGTSRGIPERPFIRQTADNHPDELFSALDEAAKRVLSGGTAQEAANHVGVKVKAVMQKEIETGGFDANSPITIAMKGSDVPLIDTGQMRQSVHYVVRKKGSGEE